MEGNSFIGQLQELLLELSTFRGDDILVNLNDKHCIQLPLGKHELTNELEKIISEANKIEKEKGVQDASRGGQGGALAASKRQGDACLSGSVCANKRV